MRKSHSIFFELDISSIKYFFAVGILAAVFLVFPSQGSARDAMNSTKDINAGFRNGNGSMSRIGHLNNSRYRWRYQVHSRISDQRQRGQSARQELRRMMIPGYQEGSYREKNQGAVRDHIHSKAGWPHNKGEFVLPEDTKAAPPTAPSPVVVNDQERERMDKHEKRYQAMSDTQKTNMQKQMRRVRPLSTEERGDVAERQS
ncbi:MAG: hypothetical protein CL917_15385 [Deltaproteobacteria bacterium]|nr:hypothetical protein [Deltaproteobacteria bacterium]